MATALHEGAVNGAGGSSRPRQWLLSASDGPRYHQITVRATAEGALELHEHEMGACPGACWGLDDRELTVTVASADVLRLATALVAQRLTGRRDAAEALVALCEGSGVEPALANWT